MKEILNGWNGSTKGDKIGMLGLFLTIVTLVVTIVLTLAVAVLTKDELIAATKTFTFYIAVILIAIAFVYFTASVTIGKITSLKRKHKNDIDQLTIEHEARINSLTDYYQNKLESQQPEDTSVRYERFEQIERPDKIIKYGHINYPPLLHYVDDIPNGIGITLLKKIFGEHKIDCYDEKTHWHELEALLNQKGKKDDYLIDIIATPLFETKERSKNVLFCSPIFFSEVGIYINKDGKVYNEILEIISPKKIENSLGFNEAIGLIEKVSLKLKQNKLEIKAKCIKGEISEKMAKRRLKIPEGNIKASQNRYTLPVTKLIDTLTDPDKESDIVCMEVYQAGMAESVIKGTVINILASKELLYPVSFAVRKEDYILRNYINLKLLEIDRASDDGILGIIIEQLIKCGDAVGKSLKQLEGNRQEQIKLVKKYFIYKRAVDTKDGEQSAALQV